MGGECTPRTHGTRPCSNTPLHMMAKAMFKYIDESTYRSMIATLLNAGGGVHLVDNKGMNAVMHAAGVSNTVFFEYFHRRAWWMMQNTQFNWNQQNTDRRNCLGLAQTCVNAQAIRSWCLDLVNQNILNASDPPDWAKPHLRQKEVTSAHRRDRGALANPGTQRQAHQIQQRLRALQRVQGQGVVNPAPAASSTPAASSALSWLTPVVVDPTTVPPPCTSGVVNPAPVRFCPDLQRLI